MFLSLFTVFTSNLFLNNSHKGLNISLDGIFADDGDDDENDDNGDRGSRGNILWGYIEKLYRCS